MLPWFGSVTLLGMGTEFGTFIGTDRILPEVPSIDSREVNWYHISVPEGTFMGVSYSGSRDIDS